MKLHDIKGAIFDMDGTLVDSLMLWDVLWEALGERFLGRSGFRPTAEEDKAVRTMTLKGVAESMHQIYGFAESAEALRQIARDIFLDFYQTKVQLKPGVREFLEECRSRGIKMCLATATAPRLLQPALEHCGIGDYFSQVLSCAQIGKGKDRPDIYLAALESLGTAPEETCVFEDSLVAIETAHKIGLKTVAIYDRYNYGQEQMKAIADEYIEDGETLMRLV